MAKITATKAVLAAKIGPQIVGNIGMYYAAYRLSQQGWNVMPTARNAKGIDLAAYNVDARIFRGIQVKTLSKRLAVPLGNTLDNIMGHWWIIVIDARSANPVCFIMKPNEVERLAKRDKGVKDKLRRPYWLPWQHYDKKQFREKWGRIGRGDVV